MTVSRCILAFALVLIALPGLAVVKVSGIFGHRMVLQRDMAVPVWGWSDPGESVTVTFGGQSKTATSDAYGNWRVALDAMEANAKGQELVIKGATNTLTYKHILVGEVWICSGQSNMEWAMGWGVKDPAPKDHNKPLIRHAKIAHRQSGRPQQDIATKWEVCANGKIRQWTATGLYFARRLHAELNVPIGLINSSWGGTRVEPWTPAEGFFLADGLKDNKKAVSRILVDSELGKQAHSAYIASMEAWVSSAKSSIASGKALPPMPQAPEVAGDHRNNTRIYNAMINPFVGLAMRGVIWYQGESNAGENDTYFQKKRALIKGWRQKWGQGDFPFYFVQLAAFQQPNETPGHMDGWAFLREAQCKTLAVPNTGMAVTIDVGNAKDIHPRNKYDVGERLAKWALAKTYGKALVYSGPLYKSHTIEGSSVRVQFDHVGPGLMVGQKKGFEVATEVPDGELKRFEIAGDDKQWYHAMAIIDGNTVVVSNPKVTKPVAIRYGFQINPAGANLYNKAGLPASPFRTDNWPFVKK